MKTIKKQSILWGFLSILLVGLAACNFNSKIVKNEHITSIQDIAYKSLDAGDKSQLENNKAIAKVEKRIVTERIATLTDTKYNGKEVYVVIFKAKKNSLLGDISVYIDENSNKVIGRGIRE